MKKQFLFITIAAFAGFLMLSGQAIAGPANNLNWGYNLNASETACPSGPKVLDISYKISNSLDSGTGANDFGAAWWAMIDYVLHVKVVDLGDNTYCATVKNQGSFESVGGDGPGCSNDMSCGTDEGRLEAGVVGTFQGAQQAMKARRAIASLDPRSRPSSTECGGFRKSR